MMAPDRSYRPPASDDMVFGGGSRGSGRRRRGGGGINLSGGSAAAGWGDGASATTQTQQKGSPVGKTWNYIKTWFGKKTEEIKDPEIEIEQAIQEAQKRDQQLRNQAAQVIAHRTNVAAELEESSGDMAEARELAKQALLRADAATKAGNAADADKWNATAQQVAMKMQASQNTVNMLQEQLKTADVQAQKAKDAVKTNATRCRSWPPSACSSSASSSRPRCRRASTRPWTR